MMPIINPKTGCQYPRRIVLADNADKETALRILIDRYGSIDYTVHPEGDTDAIYFEPMEKV